MKELFAVRKFLDNRFRVIEGCAIIIKSTGKVVAEFKALNNDIYLPEDSIYMNSTHY